jgi:hypothetical protein
MICAARIHARIGQGEKIWGRARDIAVDVSCNWLYDSMILCLRVELGGSHIQPVSRGLVACTVSPIRWIVESTNCLYVLKIISSPCGKNSSDAEFKQ